MRSVRPLVQESAGCIRAQDNIRQHQIVFTLSILQENLLQKARDVQERSNHTSYLTREI